MKNSIKFLPLLVIYIFVVLIASQDSFIGDEGRYVMFANNLTEGYYSPTAQDEINLWSGPGYPIFLVPFIFLKIPWLIAKLFNALFLFMAILYFFSTLRLYMLERSALIFSYLLGLYYPFMRGIYLVTTEQFAIFLSCGFSYHFCKLCNDNKMSRVHLFTASLFLGYLALTKVFFGYVIMVGLLVFLSLYLLKKRDALKKTFLVYLFALFCCTPYLFYTYSLTGKILYWGNSGGIILYLMSSPYENEFGDWYARHSENHREFYGKLQKLSPIERDSEYKKQAVRNIISHPVKYLKNWTANIGRLMFHYPYSYEHQKLSTYFFLIPNMFLYVTLFLCIYPAYLRRGLIPYEMYALIFFAFISFGGLSLVSSSGRYTWPFVPVFMLWISFTLTRILKIEILR